MQFTIEIPPEHRHKDLIEWLTTMKNGGNFESNVIEALNVYVHLMKSMKYTFSSGDLFENIDTKMSHKLELFHNHLVDTIQQPLHLLQETVQTFQTKSSKSSTKGAIGEQKVLRSIESYFPDAQVTDKSGEAHQGDLHLDLYGYKILIEVKTYSRNVPEKEITKFKNDVKNNDQIDAGILVSLTSGIVRHRQFDYEIHSISDKPLVYVPNCGDIDVNGAIVWAVLFATMVLRHSANQNCQSNTLVNHAMVQNAFRNQLQWIELVIRDLGDIRNQVNTFHESISQSIDRHRKIVRQKVSQAQDILRKQCENWKHFIETDNIRTTALPSGSQISSSQSSYKCNKCNKEYKLERFFLKHCQDNQCRSLDK